MPRIRPILAMLEPMALPMPSPGFPSQAASPETSISGADVPMPTMVRPTTSGETPRLRAVTAAPAMNRSALQVSTTKPTARVSRYTAIRVASIGWDRTGAGSPRRDRRHDNGGHRAMPGRRPRRPAVAAFLRAGYPALRVGPRGGRRGCLTPPYPYWILPTLAHRQKDCQGAVPPKWIGPASGRQTVNPWPSIPPRTAPTSS